MHLNIVIFISGPMSNQIIANADQKLIIKTENIRDRLKIFI